MSAVVEGQFAEGVTSADMATYLALVNPSGTATTATVTYRHANGATCPTTVAVAAERRVTLATPSWVPAGSYGITVTAPVGIVAERMVYGGPSWAWGHAGVASPVGATAWRFAEGATGWFETYGLARAGRLAPPVRGRRSREARCWFGPAPRGGRLDGSATCLFGRTFSAVKPARDEPDGDGDDGELCVPDGQWGDGECGAVGAGGEPGDALGERGAGAREREFPDGGDGEPGGGGRAGDVLAERGAAAARRRRGVGARHGPARGGVGDDARGRGRAGAGGE